MERRISILPLLIILGFIIYYGQFWVRYYFAIEKSNKEDTNIACKEHMQESFTGVIILVDKNDEVNVGYMGNFFSLQIETEDTANRHISYQYLKKGHLDIIEFADTGQIIKKITGQDYFTLTNNNGQTKKFIVPSCGKNDDD